MNKKETEELVKREKEIMYRNLKSRILRMLDGNELTFIRVFDELQEYISEFDDLDDLLNYEDEYDDEDEGIWFNLIDFDKEEWAIA